MNSEKKTSDAEDHTEAAREVDPSVAPQGWLRDYETIKFELAGLIREASSAAWLAKQEALQRNFQELLKRLAEDRFYLTFAGQFSRGKTTLMNAMLGMDRLPTGALPVTSVITAVSYNTRERVIMRFENSNLSREVPLSELSEWVTERGNSGNQRKIEMAEVQIPAEILRRGAFFVDTPGLGSAVIENTETTNRFLPHIDALVLVTSFDAPLSHEEISFLRRAQDLHRKVFVVINKLDVCPPRQRDEALAFIRARLAGEASLDEFSLFPVSASEALAAKLEGNPVRLERSGLPIFERSLVSYLITDKFRDFLRSTFDRIASLLSFPGVPDLRKLEDRLEEIRSKVPDERQYETHMREDQIATTGQVSTPQALKISRCFVCERMADETFKFMSRFQYELSHSREKQLLHASRSGFCALHSREYARLASPQGIASGYPNTLLSVAERLRGLLSTDGSHDWKRDLERLMPSREKCQACTVVAECERSVVERFVREYQETEQKSDFEVPCVCLRHLEAILEATAGPDLAISLISHSVAVLQRIAENLERYALRHGGLHMELVTKEELEAPEKGLGLLVGQPNVRPLGYF